MQYYWAAQYVDHQIEIKKLTAIDKASHEPQMFSLEYIALLLKCSPMFATHKCTYQWIHPPPSLQIVHHFLKLDPILCGLLQFQCQVHTPVEILKIAGTWNAQQEDCSLNTLHRSSVNG